MKVLSKCLLITISDYLYKPLAASDDPVQSSSTFIDVLNLIIPAVLPRDKEWVWLQARTETLGRTENKTYESRCTSGARLEIQSESVESNELI